MRLKSKYRQARDEALEHQETARNITQKKEIADGGACLPVFAETVTAPPDTVDTNYCKPLHPKSFTFTWKEKFKEPQVLNSALIEP